MEIELLLENIKKISGKLDTIDKKIIKNKDFIPLLKSNAFQNLDDFKEFYSELREILEKCPNNKLGPNLLPIDPTTNLEINIDNITVYNEMCYNINTLPKSNSKWKKLLGLFLVSLAGGSAMFKYGDKIPEIKSYLKTVGNHSKPKYPLDPLPNLYKDIKNGVISSYADVSNQITQLYHQYTDSPSYPIVYKKGVEDNYIKENIIDPKKKDTVTNYTYFNDIDYKKGFKDFWVTYSEISTNLKYEDILNMDLYTFIKTHSNSYNNVKEIIDKVLSIDSKNFIENFFGDNPDKFIQLLLNINDYKFFLLTNEKHLNIKNVNEGYLERLLYLKIIMENRELYDKILFYHQTARHY